MDSRGGNLLLLMEVILVLLQKQLRGMGAGPGSTVHMMMRTSSLTGSTEARGGGAGRSRGGKGGFDNSALRQEMEMWRHTHSSYNCQVELEEVLIRVRALQTPTKASQADQKSTDQGRTGQQMDSFPTGP